MLPILRRSPASGASSAVARDGRLAALHRLRGALVGPVVLHHAVLAYCTFGQIDRLPYALSTAPILDPRRWLASDVLVLVDDAVFMPLLFGLPGLFGRDGLRRKGPAAGVGRRRPGGRCPDGVLRCRRPRAPGLRPPERYPAALSMPAIPAGA